MTEINITNKMRSPEGILITTDWC